MTKSPKKSARRANGKSATHAARGKKTVIKSMTTKPGTTTAKIISMMARPKGATREQILKACGWKAISMQQVTEKAHVKLKVDRKVKPFIYRVS